MKYVMLLQSNVPLVVWEFVSTCFRDSFLGGAFGFHSNDLDDYSRPGFYPQAKFRPNEGIKILEAVQNELLAGEVYTEENALKMSQRVADEVKIRLKGLGLTNYKYVVQVILSEQRGQAADVVAQCVWDSDCDVMAHSLYSNDSLWCEAIIFAVFHY